MAPAVSILGAGLMGTGIGARLVENGVEVSTVLAGRSAASRERARAAGLTNVTLAESCAADLVLSIVPPGEAAAAARDYAAGAARTGRRPVFVDCNAVGPNTVKAIAATIKAAGLPFVDACIIGGPPTPGTRGPAWYACGDDAGKLLALADYGLSMTRLGGPVGTASAFKMCYGGTLKGVTAIGSAMILTAQRAGMAAALRAEMADSMPEILAFLDTVLPNMPSRTARWVDEMAEVADFIGDARDEAAIYRAIAAFFARLAADYHGEAAELAVVADFVAP